MTIEEPILERTSAQTTDPTLGWTELAKDPQLANQSAGPTVVAYEGRLYAFGGDGGTQVLSSGNGGCSWTALQADFPARQRPEGAVFRDMLWLVGGVGRDDSWASKGNQPDKWFQRDTGAPWGPRFGHTLINYKDEQLFLIGGVKTTRPRGDVWSITEGSPWTPVITRGLTPRIDAAGAALGDLLVVLGGNGEDGALAEAAVSVDRGESWTSRAVPWAARWGAQAVVFEGALYLMGGTDGTTVFRDVWTTTDAVIWTQLEAPAPWSSLTGFGAGAIGDRFVVVGGEDDSGPNPQAWGYTRLGWRKIGQFPLLAQVNDACSVTFNGTSYCLSGIPRHGVQSTPDGVQWTDVVNNLAQVKSAATANDKAMFVCGGNVSEGCGNGVWSSTDGAQWPPNTPAAEFPIRNGEAMAWFNGKLWIIGGSYPPGQALGDVWTSDTGEHWQPDTTPGFSARFGAAAAVFKGQLFVVGGSSGQSQVIVHDGSRWEDRGAPWEFRLFMRAQVVGDRLYAFGGWRSSVEVLTDIWATRDGRNWTQVDAGGGAWTQGRGFGCAAINCSLVAFGGRDTQNHGAPDVYAYVPGVLP